MPAVPTSEMLKVVAGFRFRPVPAKYGTVALIWANVMAVVPNVIVPIVLQAYNSPAPVLPACT